MKTKPILSAAQALHLNKEVRGIVQRLKQIRKENRSVRAALTKTDAVREANAAGHTEYLCDHMLRSILDPKGN